MKSQIILMADKVMTYILLKLLFHELIYYLILYIYALKLKIIK